MISLIFHSNSFKNVALIIVYEILINWSFK